MCSEEFHIVYRVLWFPMLEDLVCVIQDSSPVLLSILLLIMHSTKDPLSLYKGHLVLPLTFTVAYSCL